MNPKEIVTAAKLTWQCILKPLAKWRIKLARRREAAKTIVLVLLISGCAGCASLDKYWIWLGDNTSIEGQKHERMD